MIHRPSRNQLALQLRRYLNGRITNWDLDDSGDRLEDDGASEIWEIIWTTYSDFPKFRAVGDRQVEGDLRQQYLRAILFLDSDLEYEWPPWAIGAPCFLWLRNLLTRGRAGREFDAAEAARIKSWEEAGDSTIWPFVRKSDYDTALQSARRLAGIE